MDKLVYLNFVESAELSPRGESGHSVVPPPLNVDTSQVGIAEDTLCDRGRKSEMKGKGLCCNPLIEIRKDGDKQILTSVAFWPEE